MKKNIYKKMHRDLGCKAVVLGIVLVFVFSAFTPAIGLQVESIATNQSFEESKKITADAEKSITLLHSNPQDPSPLDAGVSWWNAGWGYRKEITIDYSKVAADFNNFPVLISLPSDSDLSDDAQDDGDDIVFTDYYGLKLNHEIELFNGTNGKLVAWVNVTSLSSSSDTIMYMYYGNPSVGNQENIEGTWDDNYIGVWHMNETSGTKCYDATSNALIGSIKGDVILSQTGIAGYCYDLDTSGTSDPYVDGDISLPATYSTWTVEGWLNMDTSAERWGNLFSDAGGSESFPSQIEDALQNNNAKIGAYSTGVWSTSIFPLGKTAWVYAVITADGSDTRVFWNGILEAIDSGDSRTIAGAWTIGCHYSGGSEHTDALFDEVRVSKIARSSYWITTCYNNIYTPSTFYNIGSETSTDAPIVSNPSPGNGAVDVPITLSSLSFQLNDTGGDLMDYSVTTVPDIGSDSTFDVGNATYTVSVSGLSYGTTYVWYVNVTDPLGSGNWTNVTYTFITRPENYLPVLSNPSPADGAYHVQTKPILSVTVNDRDDHLMNLTWYENTTGTFQQVAVNNSIGNGTYYYQYVNATENNTKYQWKVNVSDGHSGYDEQTYQFTTGGLYTYVIITDDAFVGLTGVTYTFEDLLDQKIGKGMGATIVSIQDIVSNPDYWVTGKWGDGNSSNPYISSPVINLGLFNDTQSKIRNFIRDAHYTWGVEYVLLGGDADSGSEILPFRLMWNHVTAGWPGPGTSPKTGTIPSDMYYGCLDGSWNEDEDSQWGENATNNAHSIDEADWHAEVYTGRACVDDSQEVSNFVGKTLQYVGQTGYEPYLKEAYMVGDWMGWGGVANYGANYKDEIIDGSSNHGRTTVGVPTSIFNVSTLYTRDTSWGTSDIVGIVNDGIHIMNACDHGSQTGTIFMNNAHVDALTNDELCFIYMGIPCSVAAFNYNDCFAEHWTVENPTGAFAVVMNTRGGWGAFGSTDGPGQWMDREFWDAIFNESKTELGRALADAREDNLWHMETMSPMRWNAYQNTLFGDPELSLIMPITSEKPVVSNENPVNGSTLVSTTLSSLSFYLSDPQSDLMDYTVETMPYIGSGFGNDVSDGTYSISVSGLTPYILYTWYVNVSDNNGHDTHEIFTFTTAPDEPVLSSPVPADSASGIPLTPTLSINVADYQGDNMDIYFRTNASGSWQTIQTHTNVGDGTYTCTNTGNMNQYSTRYWWSVNATDYGGGGWTNMTYSFTTIPIPGGWYNTDWMYRKKITIDHDKVDEDLTNFPVLINFVDGDLVGKTQTDGKDLLFTSYYSLKLNHEIEYYNNTNGELFAWVNVTILSSSVDTILYMYYGNLGCSSQENPAGVWHTEYRMVQHFEETSGVTSDSTIYGHDGLVNNVHQDAVGLIDGADEFVYGDTSYSRGPYFDVYNEYSVGLWFNADTLSNWQCMFEMGGTSSERIMFYLLSDEFGAVGHRVSGYTASSDADLSTGTWYYAVFTFNYSASPQAHMYLNSVDLTLTNNNGIGQTPSLHDKYNIGANHVSDYAYDGRIDDLWFTDHVCSLGWVSTSYKSQSNPDTFYSVGSEETASSSGTVVSIIPANKVVLPGETFNVSVYVEPNQPIKGWELKLSFDASLLQANSVTEGDLFSGHSTWFKAGTINNTNGYITGVFNLIMEATGNVSSPGAACNISFTAKSVTGNSLLDLYDVGVTNETSYVSITVYDGMVTIGDTIPPEISDVTLTMSDPIDTDPLYGWENISCTVTDNVEVRSVFLNITYPDLHIENVSMADGGGGQYYYNTTYTAVGSYSYHIWANDTSDNSNTTTVNVFQIPPNWDIYVDGKCSVLDLVYVSNHYDEIGPYNGWIREDVDNNGMIKVLDLVLVSNHYDETWP